MISAFRIVIRTVKKTFKGERGKICQHPFRPLGQHLESMSTSYRHHSKGHVDKTVRHVLMEQVAEAVDEDAARLLPMQRDAQAVGMEYNGPRVLSMPGHDAGHVAISAPLRHAGTSGDGIPRRLWRAVVALRPLDLSVRAHQSLTTQPSPAVIHSRSSRLSEGWQRRTIMPSSPSPSDRTAWAHAAAAWRPPRTSHRPGNSPRSVRCSRPCGPA